MVSHRSDRTSERRSGFTLLELLLAIVILMSLLGALVLNFESVLRGRNLQEGAQRVTTLIRFVQAEAASTGRTLHLQFVPVESAQRLRPVYTMRLAYEPDPLTRPGEFAGVPNLRWIQDGVNELVAVEDVRRLGTNAPAGGGAGGGPSGTGAPGAAGAAGPGASAVARRGLRALKFYPDGSSDSAELTIVDREELAGGRRRLRIAGLTGHVSEAGTPPRPAYAGESTRERGQ